MRVAESVGVPGGSEPKACTHQVQTPEVCTNRQKERQVSSQQK